MVLRKARPDKAQAIVDPHGRTVREICGRDYEPNEIEAWPANQSAARVLPRIERGEVYVAVGEAGEVLGFASRGGDQIQALYVSAAHQGEGVGSALLAQLDLDAREEGVEELCTHSTVTAVGFYERRGYDVGERVDCPVTGGIPLTAHVVRKRLGESSAWDAEAPPA